MLISLTVNPSEVGWNGDMIFIVAADAWTLAGLGCSEAETIGEASETVSVPSAADALPAASRRNKFRNEKAIALF